MCDTFDDDAIRIIRLLLCYHMRNELHNQYSVKALNTNPTGTLVNFLIIFPEQSAQ